MAHQVVMPQLGLSMDSGAITRWLKLPGEQVRPGDVLLEVESDKATVEVEATEGGRLHTLQGPDDGDIPVGAVVAYLLAEGENPPLGAETGGGDHVTGGSNGTASPSEGEPATAAEAEAPAWPRRDRPPSSPAARRRARELGVDWRVATGTGPGGRIKERDVVRLENRGAGPSIVAGPTVISPVARRLAEAVGMDVTELATQFPGRRIERADVERVIREGLAALREGRVAPSAARPGPHRERMSRMRRLIADRMARSARTAAAVTLTTEADATDLVRMRDGWKSDARFAVLPSYNALFAKLATTALAEHPELNASIDGEDIVLWKTVNIGFAVDTERGLVVPVVHDVEVKSIPELAAEMDDLLSRARVGKARPDELAGSTFTITNLGVYDIDGFTPIINAPECAVLGIGRLAEKMAVREGKPTIRTMVVLSLTFDHRLVDGVPAARFLQRVKQFAEQPYLWLI